MHSYQRCQNENKFQEIGFLEKYKIAESIGKFRSDYDRLKKKTSFGYVGYKTKSAYYILSPWTLEKNPSCRITVKHGAKCFASGKHVPLKALEKILKKGWIRSWNARNLSVDKYKEMYKHSRQSLVLMNSVSDDDTIPF